MTKVVGDNLIMHVRKKLRQKFGYPQGLQMSATGKIKGSNGKKPKQTKKWNIPTIHTMPTGVKRGTSLGPAGEGNFRKCDVAFGNSCFSTGTVGFLMASVVVNSIAGDKGKAIPAPIGFVGRMRGPVPVRSLKGNKAVVNSEPIELSVIISDTEGKDVDKIEPIMEIDDSICNCGKSNNEDKTKINSAEIVELPGECRESVIADAIQSVSTGVDGLHMVTILVDSHCHLQLDPLYSKAEEAIQFAKQNQISFAVVCGTCPGDDWNRVRNLYKVDPGFISPQFGLHPWWISRHLESLASDVDCIDSNIDYSDGSTKHAGSADSSNDLLSQSSAEVEVKQKNWEYELENILLAIPAAGVGECGLDHGIKNVNMSTQIDILQRHIRIAARQNRSVTIHCVGAWGQLLEVLKGMEKEEKNERKKNMKTYPRQDKRRESGEGDDTIVHGEPSVEVALEVGNEIEVKGKGTGVTAYVLHSCNSLSVQMADEFLKISSVYFSFSGRALSANKEGKLASRIPLDRILVETDSPDQLPLFLRNKLECNEPSLVRLNLGVLAGLMKIDPNILASSATANSIRIFKP